MEPDRPDMMAPMQRSAREGRGGLIWGISIDSLSMVRGSDWDRP
jgi:hypothetical protein